MPAERYYLNQPLASHIKCDLTGSEFHHLAHVMRTQVNDPVEVINGEGVLAHATVDRIEKERAVLKILTIEQEENPSRLILAQAIPKPNRLDFIVEKGTELGVDTFLFFPGKLSQKKELFPKQLERAKHLTISAMKQCGRLYLPKIEVHPPVSQWHSLPSPFTFFGDTDPAAPALGLKLKEATSSSFPVVFITGPESGFSQDEIDELKKMGAIGVKLHANILRTDTASLAALAIIQHPSLTI